MVPLTPKELNQYTLGINYGFEGKYPNECEETASGMKEEMNRNFNILHNLFLISNDNNLRDY